METQQEAPPRAGVCIACGGPLFVDVRSRHAVIDAEGVGKRCVLCSCIDTDNSTIGEVYAQLRSAIEVMPDSGLESFCCPVDWYARAPEHARSTLVKDKPALWLLTRESPFPQGRWLACYAVTGSNEGHYIHVDAIVDHGNDRHVVSIFQGKTFGGREAAYRIAAKCADLLGA